MATCSNCNTELTGGLAQCPNCGNSVAADAPQVWPPSTGIGVAAPAGKPKMDPVLLKRSNILIVVAILLAIIGLVMDGGGGGTGAIADIGIGIRIIALIPWFWGLGCYAKARGYSYALGALGILSLIGLIILAVIPIRRQAE
jgi:hypothetical protein